MSSKRWVFLRIILAVAILVFLIRPLIRHWSAIDQADLEWNPVTLAIALGMLIALQNMFMIGWMIILRGMGMSLSWRRAFAIFHQSQMIRYVPGNIWHLVGRAYMAAAEGLQTSRVFYSMLLENTLVLLAAIIVFGISLPFWHVASHVHSLWYFALVPPLAALMYPPLLNRLLNAALIILRKPTVQIDIRYRSVLRAAGFQCLTRIVGGICLFVIISGVYPQPITRMPAIIGIHSLSFAAGYVSFITPSGIGVREAATAYLLSSYMPLPVAVMISLLARLVWTISELASAGMGLLVGRIPSTNAAASDNAAASYETFEALPK